jgi:hypothetical protein
MICGSSNWSNLSRLQHIRISAQYGMSSTRGAFRVRMPVDDVMINKLRSRGILVEFETSSDLIP